MAQKKHTPEDIVAKLRQVDVLLSQGRPFSRYAEMNLTTVQAIVDEELRGAEGPTNPPIEKRRAAGLASENR